jgi:hypothetical protein
MRDQPDAADLLQTARRTLLEELLPALPKSCRYAASMTANAMAIAARETGAGREDPETELAHLRALYETGGKERAGHDPATELAELDRRLAADLRAGRFPSGIDTPVFELLLRQTRARLRISNPKHLESWDLS